MRGIPFIMIVGGNSNNSPCSMSRGSLTFNVIILLLMEWLDRYLLKRECRITVRLFTYLSVGKDKIML